MENHKMRNIEIPLRKRMKVLFKEIWNEIVDPLYTPDSFSERIIYGIKEGFDMYNYKILKEMIEKSMELSEANWYYNGVIGIFRNKDDENIQIALALPKNESTKYIYANIGGRRKIITAFPYELHRNIVDYVSEKSNQNLFGISGGYIKTLKKIFSKPLLILYGSSQDFGEANHEEVASYLKRYGLEAIFMNKINP